MKLDPFYPIVDRADWVGRLLPLGVRLVQLRMKGVAPKLIREELRLARDLCAAAGATLVVNDYWQAAIDERCGFVHLGQEDLETADLAAIRRAGLRLGVSTHDEAELERALGIGPDYVALGPVYPTTLKELSWQPQGLAPVSRWKRRLGDCPLVAIGGLTVERAPDVLAAGADALAVATDVTGRREPEARVAAWLAATAVERG